MSVPQTNENSSGIPNQTVPTIVAKYEFFLEYFYPIINAVSKKHGILKQTVIENMFSNPSIIYKALKSTQPKTALYELDSNLAELQFHIIFLASPKRKLISLKQASVASSCLKECRSIMGAWIKKVQNVKSV
jgi:hypothetical protein